MHGSQMLNDFVVSCADCVNTFPDYFFLVVFLLHLQNACTFVLSTAKKYFLPYNDAPSFDDSDS